MARPEAQGPSVMLAMLIGIGSAEVLKFVEDEKVPALGILIETLMSETTCPNCGGAVEACDSATEDLPPTTAGLAQMLVRWKSEPVPIDPVVDFGLGHPTPQCRLRAVEIGRHLGVGIVPRRATETMPGLNS